MFTLSQPYSQLLAIFLSYNKKLCSKRIVVPQLDAHKRVQSIICLWSVQTRTRKHTVPWICGNYCSAILSQLPDELDSYLPQLFECTVWFVQGMFLPLYIRRTWLLWMTCMCILLPTISHVPLCARNVCRKYQQHTLFAARKLVLAIVGDVESCSSDSQSTYRLFICWRDPVINAYQSTLSLAAVDFLLLSTLWERLRKHAQHMYSS